MTLESLQMGFQKKHPLINLKGDWFESLLCFTGLCASTVTIILSFLMSLSDSSKISNIILLTRWVQRTKWHQFSLCLYLFEAGTLYDHDIIKPFSFMCTSVVCSFTQAKVQSGNSFWLCELKKGIFSQVMIIILKVITWEIINHKCLEKCAKMIKQMT